MMRTWAWTAVAAVAIVGALARPASAVVRYVDDDGLDPFQCEGAPYTTIGAAIAASGPGDEIRVCPGTYAEQVVIDKTLRLTGISFGTARPVIKPAGVPAVRPSALGAGNPVAAGILVDDDFVRMENLDVDMSDTSVGGCFPLLAGIYLRNTSGELDSVRVLNATVHGHPECDSGVGVYIESSQIGDNLGVPIIGIARVRIRDCEFSGYQKAGLVANGERAIVIVKGGSATGLGPTDGAVQAGYQLGFGAHGILSDVTVSNHGSTIVGKAASDILIFKSDRISLRKMVLSDSEEGVLAIGKRVRVKKNRISNMTGDGVVFFGNSNLASGNLIEKSSVSGVFVLGDNNTVRGGVIRDELLGVWFQAGFGNKFGGIDFQGVPVAGEGVFGGVRTDLTTDSAVPFTTLCEAALDCDDGNECTSETCETTGACTITPLTGPACGGGTGTCNNGVCQ